MKQETLEQAAERILANNVDGLKDLLQDDDLFFFYKVVIQCYGEAMAKWQSERMFSEVIEFAEWIRNNPYVWNYPDKLNDTRTTEELFEQFKKK